MAKHKSLHYLILVGAIALGAMLRFWHLDLKPLWMDEVITAIFSLGKKYNDVPMEVVFPLSRLQEIFSFQPGVSCPQIAQTVARESTHPPLFFCWMYSWLGWMSPLAKDWVIKLRSLPALFGVGAIAVIYCVNRIAFFPSAGITAAGVMAVSPFAVYLSQEARHYSLPMLLISLALLGLVQIQQDIEKRQVVRFWVWLAWAIINSMGLYVHYFCVLAFIAQIATLLVLMYWRGANIQNHRKIWLALILSTSGVVISFFPWLLVMLSHSRRAETDWLPFPQHIAPLYQTFIGWVLMVIALPVENQPLPIVIISGLLMLLFGIWVGWQVFKGLRQLWCTPSTHLATLTLLSFSIFILVEFFAIVYFLKKDITAIPRYNFVYYPSFCALIAASLSRIPSSKYTLLLVSFVSCVFVVSNLAFQKPFQPEQVAQRMNQNPSIPLMVVMAYRDVQDVALGLSFALALEPLRGVREVNTPFQPYSNFAFFKQSPDFQSVWQKLSQVPAPGTSRLNLWIIGPGRKHRDYPQQVVLFGQTTCTIDPKEYYRIGIPYQLYRCKNFEMS
ncbi:MAG: glycosyltransferase family 39 protein [Stigonema ocellatum SAG 48.90 = DSM 106950]|nr:glycosyltransferase family 39 protein [Stigonema ocellatum SAG 48.90 = DSM 106950]